MTIHTSWQEAAQNLDAPPDRAHPAALWRPASCHRGCGPAFRLVAFMD